MKDSVSANNKDSSSLLGLPLWSFFALYGIVALTVGLTRLCGSRSSTDALLIASVLILLLTPRKHAIWTWLPGAFLFGVFPLAPLPTDNVGVGIIIGATLLAWACVNVRLPRPRVYSHEDFDVR